MEGLVSVTSQLTKPDKEVESMITNKKSDPEDIQHTFVPTKEGMAQGMVMTFGMKQLYKVTSVTQKNVPGAVVIYYCAWYVFLRDRR